MSCSITGNEYRLLADLPQVPFLEKMQYYEIVLLWAKFSITADGTFFCVTIFVLLKENQTNFQFGGTNSILFKLW